MQKLGQIHLRTFNLYTNWSRPVLVDLVTGGKWLVAVVHLPLDYSGTERSLWLHIWDIDILDEHTPAAVFEIPYPPEVSQSVDPAILNVQPIPMENGFAIILGSQVTAVYDDPVSHPWVIKTGKLNTSFTSGVPLLPVPARTKIYLRRALVIDNYLTHFALQGEYLAGILGDQLHSLNVTRYLVYNWISDKGALMVYHEGVLAKSISPLVVSVNDEGFCTWHNNGVIRRITLRLREILAPLHSGILITTQTTYRIPPEAAQTSSTPFSHPTRNCRHRPRSVAPNVSWGTSPTSLLLLWNEHHVEIELASGHPRPSLWVSRDRLHPLDPSDHEANKALRDRGRGLHLKQGKTASGRLIWFSSNGTLVLYPLPNKKSVGGTDVAIFRVVPEVNPQDCVTSFMCPISGILGLVLQEGKVLVWRYDSVPEPNSQSELREQC